MRVLVTGAGGVLGGRIAALLARETEVVAAFRTAPPPPGLPTWRGDLTLPGGVDEALAGCQAVVHCAALANADACERAPDVAEAVNVELPRQIARRCREHGVRLVVFSTDLVFDGARAPYAPEDEAHPKLVYGRSKLRGEAAVLAEAPDAAIVRVALVWGRGHGERGSSTEAILWALQRGEAVRLFTDQLRTPIDPESVARAVMSLLRGRHSGRFHLGGAQSLSRFEIGQHVARHFGLDASLIEPVQQSSSPIGASRPADVSLDSASTRRRLGWEPTALTTVLATCRQSPADSPAW